MPSSWLTQTRETSWVVLVKMIEELTAMPSRIMRPSSGAQSRRETRAPRGYVDRAMITPTSKVAAGTAAKAVMRPQLSENAMAARKTSVPRSDPRAVQVARAPIRPRPLSKAEVPAVPMAATTEAATHGASDGATGSGTMSSPHHHQPR